VGKQLGGWHAFVVPRRARIGYVKLGTARQSSETATGQIPVAISISFLFRLAKMGRGASQAAVNSLWSNIASRFAADLPMTLPAWQELARLSDTQLATLDVAETHLACAAGLPGSEAIDHDGCL